MVTFLQNPFVLAIIFVVITFVGYKVISNVPSLLHTPLMSAMNALSGVIILGSLTAAYTASNPFTKFLGCIAIFLAVVNVIGGFDVTDKMLKMVAGKKRK